MALVHQFRVNPRVGWIRTNEGDSPETLRKVTTLLEQNAALSQEIEQLRLTQSLMPTTEGRFAHENEEVMIGYALKGVKKDSVKTTWKALFELLAPGMILRCEEATLVGVTLSLISEDKNLPGFWVDQPFKGHTAINWEDWHKVTLQFLALGYWEPIVCFRNWESGDTIVKKEEVPGWKLTALGIKRLAEAKATLKA
jgi:hypothetical protein